MEGIRYIGSYEVNFWLHNQHYLLKNCLLANINLFISYLLPHL